MLSFFPRGLLDEILNLIESVSEGFSSYSLMKFLQLLMTKSLITVGRQIRLQKLLVNIQNSLARKGRVQRATAAQEQFHERLPPQVRSAYFSSECVRGIQELLTRDLVALDFIAVRNYLMTALTLWNDHRPAVLLNLTIRDVLRGGGGDNQGPR